MTRREREIVDQIIELFNATEEPRLSDVIRRPWLIIDREEIKRAEEFARRWNRIIRDRQREGG